MSSNWLVSILFFILILGVIVVSHEFGHFMIARRSGIRVKILPVGGASIFEGRDTLDEGERDELSPDAFPNAPVGARIATVLAGPAANFIIGYIFALIIVAFCGTDLPVINKVLEDSAAMEAGLEDGDKIVKIDKENIHLYREVSLYSMMNYGEPLEITYERGGERKTVTVTPKFDEEANR